MTSVQSNLVKGSIAAAHSYLHNSGCALQWIGTYPFSKVPVRMGIRSGPTSNTRFLRPRGFRSQTTFRPVQPCLHNSLVCSVHRQTHRPRYATSVAKGPSMRRAPRPQNEHVRIANCSTSEATACSVHTAETARTCCHVTVIEHADKDR